MADTQSALDNGIELSGSANAPLPDEPKDTKPNDAAQIPLAMLGMSSPMDRLTSGLRSKAESLVPKLAAARDAEAQNNAAAASAEAEVDKKYLEQLADMYKNFKPGTVDFGGAPNEPEQNPLKQFGSLGSMLGIFASSFTKRPIVNALNSSAAAMTSVRNHDMEAYHNAYKAWHDNTELALKKNQQDYEFLQTKLALAKTDNAAALAEIKAYAAANNWPAASLLAQAGDLEGLARLSKSLETAGTKMGNFKSMMTTKGVQEFIAQNKRPPNFKEMADIQATAEGKGGSAPLDDDAVNMAAEIYRSKGTLPALGYGKAATELRSQIIKRAAQMNKDEGTSAGDMLANQASVRADSTSLNQLTKVADSAISFENTALDNMEVVKNLMNKGEGTSLGPVVNRWVQGGRVATGDPDVKAFNDAIQTVANEYAKIMSGATGSQGATEGARAEAQNMVSGIDSPETINKVFDEVMKPDMENRKKRLTGQLDTIKSRIKDSTSPSVASKKAPPANLLKEGVNTTFKNGGGTWTLKNGVPTQVSP